ncbi:glyceraldehyde 3-phosphate dehydrogenase [Entomoplasma freundtii]|uniref:Glyceraldehyde-3-phosphate dehydrogenase n=1 Tax=Entomoplasma freundtii TaxID=74700 RepID=A0A2K8NSC3_9MOLU|nr:type I glyceraldehyde-3-phosphate dehydrogenase [Entomoplasma freundtii]ATZ16456.1 glyceraldehyde-3-phosphate dehydrogenase [Entomoplasma freundtii]TDY55986.1 glyceraldehyde 3-phosphate dehydrogenase [Entomoplasma freundtii]
MAQKVAINGFGRIGRLTFRQLFNKGVEIVAINDLTNTANLAYLLEYDTAQGRFQEGKISFGEGFITVDGHKIQVFAERDAANLPWGKLGVDLVIESTGLYTNREKAESHLKAGAKKVVISAPAKGVKTIAYGVNQNDLKATDDIISGASCTTNCLSPMAKVLDEKFGIKKGLMTTVHAVTNDQRLLDLPHNGDMRRGRAAAWNIIPTSTGAAVAVAQVLPNLKGKLDGLALRVPVITGSITDLAVEFEKTVTVEEVNGAIKNAIANDAELAKAMMYNEQEIVSSDVIGSSYGSVFDATLTKIIEQDGKQMVKVFAWYDNENSYVSQLVRTVLYFMGL